MKKFFKKILHYLHPYRWYYRIYYYLIAVNIIDNPKPVNPPENKFFCKLYFDADQKGIKHHNFLFVPKDNKSYWFLKLFFWYRKFAFCTSNGQWQRLPSMTPWSEEKKRIKYGINCEFVQKHLNEIDNFEFCTWW